MGSRSRKGKGKANRDNQRNYAWRWNLDYDDDAKAYAIFSKWLEEAQTNNPDYNTRDLITELVMLVENQVGDDGGQLFGDPQKRLQRFMKLQFNEVKDILTNIRELLRRGNFAVGSMDDLDEEGEDIPASILSSIVNDHQRRE